MECVLEMDASVAGIPLTTKQGAEGEEIEEPMRLDYFVPAEQLNAVLTQGLSFKQICGDQHTVALRSDG